MTPQLLHVDEKSGIPLFGLDFLGILDRGTNILEVKPITICNLHCKYCFVSAGDYEKNFVADEDYLFHWIKHAIALKECDDIEIHFAPYGEIFLYKPLYSLIEKLSTLRQIKRISMQTNGLLLTKEIIQKLSQLKVTRLDISLNSMDSEKCATYCDVTKYDLQHLLNMFDEVLKSDMELLIAPVWFKNVNDEGISDILDYAAKKQQEGYHWPKLRMGIQNYLTYKTGRKIRKAKSRQFSYFYQLLQQLESKYKLKLKLHPNDFGIHKTKAITPPVNLGDHAHISIIGSGRFNNEFIGLLDNKWAVKVISRIELKPEQKVRVKFIRSTLHGNLLTGTPN